MPREIGIEDSVVETWAQCEEKVCKILNTTLKLNLGTDDERISRAHRLGKFTPGKCRPVIIKFASSKLREGILAARAKLRACDVSVNEDFSKATRSVRKKLFEYRKASKEQYTLRYNKLYIHKKCFVYSRAIDSICELESGSAVSSNDFSSASTSAGRATYLS